jgi:RNA polymerase sigma factor (sigma-70 family)
VGASDSALVDAQVQAAITAGEHKYALELLTQAYLDLVFGYCVRVLNEHTSRAKDVTQQVFEEVCRGLARYRGESSVKTWLLAIAHYQCLKEMTTGERRRNILRQHQDDVAAHLHAEAPILAESAVLAQERRHGEAARRIASPMRSASMIAGLIFVPPPRWRGRAGTPERWPDSPRPSSPGAPGFHSPESLFHPSA